MQCRNWLHCFESWQICFLRSISSFLMKTRPYDQCDILFLHGKKLSFNLISFLSPEIRRIAGLEQNLTITLSRSKQKSWHGFIKNEFRAKYNINLLHICKIVYITLFKISCQLQQPNVQKLKVKTIKGRAVCITE